MKSYLKSTVEIEELLIHKILTCNHSTALKIVKTAERIGMVSTNKSSDIEASRCATYPACFGNFICVPLIAFVFVALVFGFATKTTIDVT